MKTMIHRSLVVGLMLLITSAFTGCTKSLPDLPDNPTFARVTDPAALKQLRLGKPVAAADIYTERAARASSEAERQDYQLTAAEILFDRALFEPGLEKFALIPDTMDDVELQQRRDILSAKSLLYVDDANGALEALPAPADIESSLHRARVFETRAQAYRVLEDPDSELIARIQLEEQLSDPAIIARSHEQIWQLLTQQPVSTLRSMTTNVRGDVYQGWIELALASEAAGDDPGLRNEALNDWQERFPRHPAGIEFVALLQDPDSLGGPEISGEPITRIAVLLPLSARNTATVSAAIRDGLIAAWQNSRDRQGVPDLRFYDVGENPGYARTAYENAVADGANAVIGPLRKQAVAAIVTQRDIPVPTVTLNTVDAANPSDADAFDDGSGRGFNKQRAESVGATTNVIQFGLSPEDEARAAASRATALSLSKAIVLQTDDNRGDREAQAFQESMYRYGGDVVYVAVLPKDQYDYSDQIRAALSIDESDQRFHALSRTIGKKLFFEPAIRNDVDVVFLAVTTEQARSVRPQLDFFHARGVTRLGTSRVAAVEDDPKKNKDLNSIYYTDAPWVLRESTRKNPLRQEIIKQFPAADGAYTKLYALGADAYRIMTELDALTQGERLDAFTGELELGSDGRIQRHLDWAQYLDGKSVPAERIEEPAIQSIRSSGIN